MPTVAELLAAGRIEEVAPDAAGARERLAEAKRHLVSAETLATDDPPLAHVALYDAARKAVTAHMLARGLRVTNRPGAHEAVGLYALAVFDAPTARLPVERFQTMRRIRNQAEYGHHLLGAQMIESDLTHATELVTIVARSLRPR
jgi:hypothetical protein